MKNILPSGLIEAARLTNAGRLTEATAALQRMLGGQTQGSPDAQARSGPPTIDGVAVAAGTAQATLAPQAGPAECGIGVGCLSASRKVRRAR